MYTLCNPIAVMDYLKKEKYRSLPVTLFDRYLWFYSQIEELTYKLAYGISVAPLETYCCKRGTAISGVAYLHQYFENDLTDLFIESTDSEGLNTLLDDIFSRKYAKLHITVCSKDIADYIKTKFGLDYSFGTVKYYATDHVEIHDERVKEMHEKDEYLIGKLSKRVWGSYKVFLENGYRFYGLIDNDELLSMCGVSRLTAFKSEIIGVETFEESDRMKGYAKATCGFALNEALKSMDIVTWSTNLKNISSCKTAESLGFKQYYTLYEFNYDKQ